MKTLLVIIILAVMSACCPCRHLVTSSRDSLRVEVRTHTEYIRDTVFHEIPAQSEKVVTRDTISHLENDYAMSDARIDTNGFLFHSLATKPQRKPVPYDRIIEYRDSIVYQDRAVKEIVQVERTLSWWQKTQIRGFWFLLVVVVFVFRKNIVSFARRFI